MKLCVKNWEDLFVEDSKGTLTLPEEAFYADHPMGATASREYEKYRADYFSAALVHSIDNIGEGDNLMKFSIEMPGAVCKVTGEGGIVLSHETSVLNKDLMKRIKKANKKLGNVD